MIIEKRVMRAVLELCRNAHPNETGGLLVGNPVNDFLIIPGRFTARAVYIHMDQIPIYTNLAGTFHSHPSPEPRPSHADLDLFGRIGREHLIIALPYTIESSAVFDSKGRRFELKVVQAKT